MTRVVFHEYLVPVCEKDGQSPPEVCGIIYTPIVSFHNCTVRVFFISAILRARLDQPIAKFSIVVFVLNFMATL